MELNCTKIRLLYLSSRPIINNQVRKLSDDKITTKQPTESASEIATEKRADFVPRIISKSTFPDPSTQKLKRGTGGRSSWNGQVVTLFGANGLVGRCVLARLGRIGTQVVFPYRGHTYWPHRLKLAGDLGQIQFVPFDLRDEDSLYRAMKYSNVVINLIGKGLETSNFSFDDVHVHGARRIARIAKELGVQRLIHVSALNCTPNPTAHVIKGGSGFLRSKYYGELAVREEFPEATIFRPADIWGQEDKFIFSLAKYQRRSLWRLPLWNGGFGVYKQPVWCTDVAHGIVNSITDDDAIGTTYEALGPRRYEFREIASYVNRCIQKYPEDMFKIKNLKWSPFFWFRIYWLDNRFNKYPEIYWEKIEREMVSDTPTGCPTLIDLGVKLTPMEERLWYELKIYRKYGNYPDETYEYPERPEPPPTVPLIN